MLIPFIAGFVVCLIVVVAREIGRWAYRKKLREDPNERHRQALSVPRPPRSSR